MNMTKQVLLMVTGYIIGVACTGISLLVFAGLYFMLMNWNVLTTF